MRTTIVLITLLCLASCARFSTTQTDISAQPDGTQRTITTKAGASTWFASKSSLANWKATQTDKTQGASVGALTQQGDTNLVNYINAIAAGVAAGMRASTLP